MMPNMYCSGILLFAGLVTATAAVDPTPVSTCDDDPDISCWTRPDIDCFGVYEPWARSHCPLRCGFCPGKLPPCENKLTNCEQFKASCLDPTYESWARLNCRKTCNRCAVPTPPATTMAVTTTTVRDPNGCYDDPAANCWSRPDADCFGLLATFSRNHCPLRCGLCPGGVTAACVDNISGCDKYVDYTCTEPSYQLWARTNCRKRCNLCAAPTSPSNVATTAGPTCVYKGVTYADGAVWEDGCQYHCYCDSGNHVCNNKCLNLDVPPSCTAHMVAGGCCPTYTCPSGVHPHIVG